MAIFRGLLILILCSLVIYTGHVIAAFGWNLLPIFLADIAKMAWPGQFNLDFTFMLTLSALWVAWRHRFSPAGLGLASLAFFGGSLFLSVYLLVVSFRARGGVTEMLIGQRALS